MIDVMERSDQGSRDDQTILIVRMLVAGAAVGVLTCLLLGGVAKLVAPDYDAGGLAWTVGWPVGFAGAVVAIHMRRRHPG